MSLDLVAFPGSVVAMGLAIAGPWVALVLARTESKRALAAHVALLAYVVPLLFAGVLLATTTPGNGIFDRRLFAFSDSITLRGLAGLGALVSALGLRSGLALAFPGSRPDRAVPAALTLHASACVVSSALLVHAMRELAVASSHRIEIALLEHALALSNAALLVGTTAAMGILWRFVFRSQHADG